jgi:hypothetical protein
MSFDGGKILNNEKRKTVEVSDCGLSGHVRNRRERVLKLLLVSP